MDKQTKHALVIGNNYVSSGTVSRLNNPINDAEDMADVLRKLGFTVNKVLNGNRVDMQNAVIRLKNRLSEFEVSYGFFFYAGHGVQSNGENYLIPEDADIPDENYLPDRSIPLQVVLKELNDANNRLNIIVLDACRDNPFRWARSGSRGLATVSNQPRGSVVVYATAAGNVASDGRDRNGLFTEHLLEYLKIPNLEIQEIFRRTMGDVERASGNRQCPAVYNQLSGLAYLGEEPLPATGPVAGLKSVQPGMILIKGGTFLMGSREDEPQRRNDESRHQVTVNDFMMGKYPVTQKEWFEITRNNPSQFKGDNLPVGYVSWYNAIEFCNMLSGREGLAAVYHNTEAGTVADEEADGYRLPTEAEWEYACRAGTTTPFNTGENITTEQANYNGNFPYNNHPKGQFREKTTPVNSFNPNAWGLYDMHGNVWEWCWDFYGDYSGIVIPGIFRVIRGGGWDTGGRELRSAFRRSYNPAGQFNSFGFRVVRSCNT